MEMKITLNGVEQAITNQQLYDLAAKGMIGPETPVYVDGKPVPAGKAKGIVFGQPKNMSGQAPTTDSGFALPPQQTISEQQRRHQQLQYQHLRPEEVQQILERRNERKRLMEERRIPMYSSTSMTQMEATFYVTPLLIALFLPGIFGVVTLAISIIVVPAILFYRCWKIIQDTPKHLRVPLTPIGLAKMTNDYCDYYGVDSNCRLKISPVGWFFVLFLMFALTAIAMSAKNPELLGSVGGVAYLCGGLLVPSLFFHLLYGPFGKIGAKIQEDKMMDGDVPGQARTVVLPASLIICLLFLVACRVALPLVQTGREADRTAQCFNNEKEIVLGFHLYHDQNLAFPPLYTIDENGKPLHSWRVLILPFVDQEELYGKIKLDEPWDSPHNKQFHNRIVDIYRCPSNRKVRNDKNCCYSVIAEGVFFPATSAGEHTGLGMDKITNGTSNTLALVEVKEPFCWMNPTADVSLTDLKNINVKEARIGSPHSGGMNTAFLDGSVRFLSSKTGDVEQEPLKSHSASKISDRKQDDKQSTILSDEKLEVERLRKAANRGDATAQNSLGARYHEGYGGVEQDVAEAIKWYRKAAEQGNQRAQNNLGNLYFYGEGVEQNY